jgi:cell division protein FtsB
MNSAYRRIAYLAAVALLGVYGLYTLRGPHGISALLEQRRQIRQLEDENATLARENDYKRDRIRKLNENTSQVEVEIRDKLKKLLPGETEFILPEAPKKPIAQPDKQP